MSTCRTSQFRWKKKSIMLLSTDSILSHSAHPIFFSKFMLFWSYDDFMKFWKKSIFCNFLTPLPCLPHPLPPATPPFLNFLSKFILFLVLWHFFEILKKKMYLFCIFQTCTSELSSTLHLYYPEWYFWIIQTLTSWLSRPVCLDYPYLLNKKYLVLFSSIGALKSQAKKPVLSKIVATKFSEKSQFCRYLL